MSSTEGERESEKRGREGVRKSKSADYIRSQTNDRQEDQEPADPYAILYLLRKQSSLSIPRTQTLLPFETQ